MPVNVDLNSANKVYSSTHSANNSGLASTFLGSVNIGTFIVDYYRAPPKPPGTSPQRAKNAINRANGQTNATVQNPEQPPPTPQEAQKTLKKIINELKPLKSTTEQTEAKPPEEEVSPQKPALSESSRTSSLQELTTVNESNVSAAGVKEATTKANEDMIDTDEQTSMLRTEATTKTALSESSRASSLQELIVNESNVSAAGVVKETPKKNKSLLNRIWSSFIKYLYSCFSGEKEEKVETNMAYGAKPLDRKNLTLPERERDLLL